MLYKALWRIHAEGLPAGCHLVLTAHDEIVFEVPNDERGLYAKDRIVHPMREVLEELLGPDLGGKGCVEGALVDHWAQE